MAWFPFGKSQVEQKSHAPVGLAPPDRPVAPGESDINHTLGQIANDVSEIDIQIGKAQNKEEANKAVTQFVMARPSNMFILDGEKNVEQSIICTNNEQGGKTCLKLQYNSIQLFKQMQSLEYFCSLPDDINATYFECRKIK